MVLLLHLTRLSSARLVRRKNEFYCNDLLIILLCSFPCLTKQSGATAAVPVLDVRAELMKSIIAGKKLNKV